MVIVDITKPSRSIQYLTYNNIIKHYVLGTNCTQISVSV